MVFSMKEFYEVQCPLCNLNESKTLSKIGQFNTELYVSICKNDGLVYLNPRWSNENYNKYYQKSYDKNYRPENLMQNEKQKAIKNSIKINERIKNYIALNKISSVCDIGSGMGWTLEWFKLNYSNIEDIYAVEMSLQCKDYIENNIGGIVISDDAEKVYTQKNIDLVISRHSLEHAMNPVLFLRNIHNNLSDDGFLYLEVPDMMNFSGSLQKYWFRVPHTYYFSKNTLLHLVNKVGFESCIIKEDLENNVWCLLKKNNKKNNAIDFINMYSVQKRKIKKQLYIDKKNMALYYIRSRIIYLIKLILNR